MRKKEKRSETIEVRIGYTSKLKFMQLCQQYGLTASDVIRGAIGVFTLMMSVGRFPSQIFKTRHVYITTAALVSMLGIFLIPGGSHQVDPPNSQTVFNQIDSDNNGLIVFPEFIMFSGLTSDGTLTEASRQDITTEIQEQIASYGDTIASGRVDEAYIDGVISNVETTTLMSLKDQFNTIDVNKDGRLYPAEFLIPMGTDL